ncbi:transposable element Tcb2 transposase [Trichonephila clavipes]|nr:transposable element Tcb2 transposase [Trichonephila clavipes]
MRVWKQWTDEHRTTRKTGSGPRKVISARDNRHQLRITVNDHTASSSQSAARWSTATDESRFNFSICGTMMAARVLDAMPMNAAFQSALSNDIVA